MYKEATESLETVNDYVRWAATQFEYAELFYGHGTDNAIDEAVALVLSVLKLPREPVPEFWQARLTPTEKKHITSVIQERLETRKPLPYLTKEARFAGLSFYVDERVIIPRSPFAELIQGGFEPWSAGRPLSRILDLCCGSGCIAIASAYAFPYSAVTAIDIDDAAIEITQMNVDGHGLGDFVEVIQSDLFEKVSGRRYDLILTNPPYVSAEDMSELPYEYEYEPKQALEAGQDGLDIVRRILREARDHLSDEGLLFCEVGNSQYALMAAFPEVPFIWLEFEKGGDGVFMLTAEQLDEYQASFNR